MGGYGGSMTTISRCVCVCLCVDPCKFSLLLPPELFMLLTYSLPCTQRYECTSSPIEVQGRECVWCNRPTQHHVHLMVLRKWAARTVMLLPFCCISYLISLSFVSLTTLFMWCRWRYMKLIILAYLSLGLVQLEGCFTLITNKHIFLLISVISAYFNFDLIKMKGTYFTILKALKRDLGQLTLKIIDLPFFSHNNYYIIKCMCCPKVVV